MLSMAPTEYAAIYDSVPLTIDLYVCRLICGDLIKISELNNSTKPGETLI